MWECKSCFKLTENTFNTCSNCDFPRDGSLPHEIEDVGHETVLTSPKSPPRREGSLVPWFVCATAILSFLLFFHVVPSAGITIFPKASPSFANTFVDLDTYLKLYNEGNFIDQMAMRQTYLFQQLKAKGLIVSVKEQ